MFSDHRRDPERQLVRFAIVAGETRIMNLKKLGHCVGLAIALLPVPAFSQQPEGWARDILRDYTNPNREQYYDNRMRAQIVLGDYRGALVTADSLKAVRARPGRALPPVMSFPHEVYATTRLNGSLDSAFAQLAARVDDPTAAGAMSYVMQPWYPRIKADYEAALARVSGQDSASMADKIDVVRRAANTMVFEVVSQNATRLLAADDERRYIITRDIQVKTPANGVVCAHVWRPRAAQGKLTALLNFTIYENETVTTEARRTAAHGYAGVEGLTRGKGCSPNQPVSHEYDGVDAAALIDWIAQQPWSDGRVGTYGGSYDGMAQWGAARHMPRALKAMMTSVTHAPGIDFPIDGNIFATYAYPWPFYTTNMKGLDEQTYGDSARWGRMMRTWYTSGRPYRDLPKIDGAPNPIFERWLAHPEYDAYWQNMVASGSDFARIDIPVLTTTGYFDSGQMGALWFYRQHLKHRPNAEHYLLVGPYDHITGQRGIMDVLGRRGVPNIQGYDLDPVADLDVGELRYQWFDHVFKGAPRPALLKDKVNYQVMNGNVWKHASSLSTMADSTLTIHLGKSVEHSVDFKDRSDVEKWGSSGDLLDPASGFRLLVDTTTNIANAITFASEPFDRPTEVSGLFSGQLEFITNKKDFDFNVTLFELTADGKYFQLSYHWQRASYAADRTRRSLLVPGRRTTLSFQNNRLTSRRVQSGSRIVVALAIAKNPSQQINYGTGKVVADESIADAIEPLRITWLARTRIALPLAANVHPADSAVVRAADAVCNKQVVVLGELPSHGEGRAFVAKAAIVRRLVAKCGFNAVLFEAPVYDFIGFQKAVAGMAATQAQLDNAIGRFWMTKDLADWRAWLLDRAQLGNLRVSGLDDQVSATSQYARDALPGLVAAHLPGDSAAQCAAAVTRNLNWQYDANVKYDDAERVRLQTCARRASEIAQDDIMLDNLANLYAREQGAGHALDRDVMMYRNFVRQRDMLRAGSKVIIWTATTHAARQRGELGTKPLGTWIAEAARDSVAMIGFSAFGGQSSMAGRPAQPITDAPAESLEAMATANTTAWVYLDNAALQRMGSVPSRLFGKLMTADWSQLFDAVLVIRAEVAPAPSGLR